MNPLRVGTANKLNFANRTAHIPTIESDFPGGNVIIEKILGDTIFLNLISEIPQENGFTGVFLLKTRPIKNGFLKLPSLMF